LSLFSLDIIHDPGNDRFVVVDLNGCRSTLSAFRRLYGDDRVQNQVLTIIAEQGRGRIHAPSLLSEPALRLYGLGPLEDAPACGLNRAAEAYMMRGSPYVIAGEEPTAALARRLGIEYVQWQAQWDPGDCQLVLRSSSEACATLDEWRPDGVIWPFSWNLRRFCFDPACRVLNPLPVHLATTNKLLLARRLGEELVPPTAAFNFLDHDVSYETYADVLEPGQLTVVKPACGRRGYGLFTPRQSDISALAREMGVAVAVDRAEAGALLFALAALQGEGWEYLALIQPFLPGDIRQHPETQAGHLVTLRALVDAFDGKCRLIDMCEILHNESVSAPTGLGRQSLVSSGELGAVLEVPSGIADRAARAAEHAVERVVATTRDLTPDAALEREIEEAIAMLSERTRIPLGEVFAFAHRRLASSDMRLEPCHGRYPVFPARCVAGGVPGAAAVSGTP